jgi:hypothetical protein
MLSESRSYENFPNAKEPISPDFFRQTAESTRIGFLEFLPMMEKPNGSPVLYSGAGQLTEQPWLIESLKNLSVDDVSTDPTILLIAINNAYQDYYDMVSDDEKEVAEPEWVNQLDSGTRSVLRRNRAFIENADTASIITGPVFNKVFGFSCVIDKKRENGILRGLEDGLWLWRLKQIQQLAWLTVPAGPGEISDIFPHDRYYHSSNVLAVSSLIGHNIGLSESDMRALQVASYTHDVLTPAGGDRTKAIDPKAFDEDANYLDAFALYPNRPISTFSNVSKWDETQKRLPDKNTLAEIVKGNGPLGKILDIADKIAYTGSDAAVYFGGTIRFSTCFEDPDYQEIEHIVKQATENGSTICAPWSDVAKEGDQIYFSSPERLAGFLKLRALMFKNLYYNPKARNVDHVLASLTGRALYQNKILSREQFLTMGDHNLKSILTDNLWGSEKHKFELPSLGNFYPEVTNCTSPEEAKQKLSSLQKDNLVLVECFKKTTSNATHLLTKIGGNIIPFSEACPNEAEELRRIFQSREGYVLYSVPFSKLSITQKAEEMLRQTQATQEIT